MLYIYFNNITFTEIVQGLVECFNKKCIKIETIDTVKIENTRDLYIMFGMNDFTGQIIPKNYIVYQLEQTIGNDESKWFTQRYINYMKNALEVWDYSLVNYQHLKKLGITNTRYFPLQYMDCINNKILHNEQDKDIDILFYGAINQRRQNIITQLRECGLNVSVQENIWGQTRIDLIKRSKVIINIHYYEKNILESARLSYLLSNQCLVISEQSGDPLLDKWHSPYLIFTTYADLAKVCVSIVNNYQEYYHRLRDNLIEYQTYPYCNQMPLDCLKKYKCLYETIQQGETNNIINMKTPVNDSNDLFEAEQEITKTKELVLKLPKLSDDELPAVSIVTITHNRKDIFPLAIRNWLLFEYPRDKLEWVIIDDSDDGTSLSDILPISNQIKYYNLQTTGRLSIGLKRNYGVDKASTEYIVFMDDDDYYYPLSIYARIALLIKYPNYDLVGVTNLDIYDIINNFSARVRGTFISEASMAFRKSFWREQQFPEEFNSLGEGYPFTKDRRHRIIKMPSCFNMIAITHKSNYTQDGRSYNKFKNKTRQDNILRILDVPTRLFIYDLFKKSINYNLVH